MAIYTVKVRAGAINDEIMVEAGSEQEAKEKAIYQALERQFKNARVAVTVVPEEGEPT